MALIYQVIRYNKRLAVADRVEDAGTLRKPGSNFFLSNPDATQNLVCYINVTKD
jgi:hypothetical protein